jgi:hypothetical protein
MLFSLALFYEGQNFVMSSHLWKPEVALMLVLQVYNRKHKELQNQHTNRGNIQEKKWRKTKSVVNTVQQQEPYR